MTMIGQYIPGDSLLHRLDARTKIIGFLLLLAAVVTSFRLSGYVFMLCAVLGVALLSKLPFHMIFGAVRRLWLFFIFIFLMNAVFFEGTQIVYEWYLFRIYAEGVNQGFSIAANVFLILLLSQVLTGTTTPIDMTAALGRLFKPFQIIGIPTEEVAMILSVAMQFVPVLLEETQSIKKAQTARGARFESRKWKERISSFFPLLIPVFIAAFRRADELSVAMEARGYRTAASRTQKIGKPLSLSDSCAIIFCSLLYGVQIFLKIKFGGN